MDQDERGTPEPAEGRELTESELEKVAGGAGGPRSGKVAAPGQPATEAAARMACQNNLKQIGLASH